ncbi:cytochrome c3 family protein [Neobacillus drentensis]|uniref:cytochrome c3 family protein n=1 Tax=Neobacillus drentensis TaxID=220684 RepID=UPI00300102F1
MNSQINIKQFNMLLVLLIMVISTILPSRAIAEDIAPVENIDQVEIPAPAEDPILTEEPAPVETPNQTEETVPEVDPVPDQDTTPPLIIVKSTTLTGNGFQVTGTVSDNQASDKPITMKLIYPDREQEIIPISGYWTFTTDILSIKQNKVKIQATDELNNTSTMPVQRPYIKSITMNVFKYREKVYGADGGSREEDVTADIDILNIDDITRVSLNQTIVIELSEELSHTIVNPFIVYDKNNEPFESSVKPRTDNNKIEISLNNLKPGETYYLKFNSSLFSSGQPNVSTLLVDDGRIFFPLIKKFSTVTNQVKNHPINGYTLEEMKDLREQPHGFYNNNTNSCSICHNTHVAANKSLEGKDVKESYCLSCHDGTITSPLKAGNSISNKHDTQLGLDHKTKAGSCTSCHNPHLSWSQENPNLLKDHFVYEHQADDDWEETTVGKIDSNVQLCESCHGRYTYSYKKKAEETGGYKALHYRKQTNAIGEITKTEQVKGDPTSLISEIEDYNLCFSCHNNDNKVKNAKDILGYYTNEESKHSIAAIDGSKLNGQIPCAECHETHGAKNLLLLKDKLGHENQSDFSLNKEEDWTDIKKRDFCLACHNGKTSIYGITGKAIYNENGDSLITTNERAKSGHAKNSIEACSNCHSSNNSFIEAVHGPITINSP